MSGLSYLSLDDNRTIQAIGILADVLDTVDGQAGIDTVLVSKALRQVIANRSETAFDFAKRAFNTLDPSLRRRVAQAADDAAFDAVELRSRVGGFLATSTRKSRPEEKAGTATGLLHAINNRHRRR